MSGQMKTRDVFPLRQVNDIDVSEKMGTELNPHYFWKTREYTLTLDCGHSEVRTSCNFEHLEVRELMPKKVRCKKCEPKVVLVRKKMNPKYDHVASALAGAILDIGDEGERDKALDWVADNGRWIEDDTQRARTYGRIALSVFDVMMTDRTVKHSDSLRSAVIEWMNDPTDDTKEAVRKVSRRLYSAQHAPGNDWFAARALVCLGRITSMGKHSSSGIIEALTWDNESREDFYKHLFQARHKLDVSDQSSIRSLTISDDVEERSRVFESAVQKRESALKEMNRIWDEEYPSVGQHHLALLFHLMNVYNTAEQDEQ